MVQGAKKKDAYWFLGVLIGYFDEHDAFGDVVFALVVVVAFAVVVTGAGHIP